MAEQNKTGNNNTASNLFTIIEISRRQRHSISSTFIKLLPMRYKRQDRANNDESERIRSDLCEDALHVKRIIVVCRSLNNCVRGTSR